LISASITLMRAEFRSAIEVARVQARSANQAPTPPTTPTTASSTGMERSRPEGPRRPLPELGEDVELAIG